MYGINTGASTIISHDLGKGNFETARQHVIKALLLSGAVSLSISGVGLLVLPSFFRLMGATENLMPMINSYMLVWLIGQVFVSLSTMANVILRASGDARSAGFLLTAGCIIATALSWFLVPRIGIAGSALAYVVSYVLMLAGALRRLHVRNLLKFTTDYRVGETWKGILDIALPSMVSHLSTPVLAAIITWLAAPLGKESVAALGVISRVESAALLGFHVTGSAMMAFTGQNAGAGKADRIREAFNILHRYFWCYSLVVTAVFFLNARLIADWLTDDRAVISYISSYLKVVPISYACFGLLAITATMLNAMKKARQSALIILFRNFLIYTPLAWLMRNNLGFEGILYAMLLSNAISLPLALLAARKVLRAEGRYEPEGHSGNHR